MINPVAIATSIWITLLTVPILAQTSPVPAHVTNQLIGVGSCSAAGCHGGDGSRKKPDGSFNFSSTAYRTWVEQDPHARAYEVLLSDQSVQMIRQLGSGWQPAHQERRCLTCHSSLETGPTAKPDHELLLDGVSCEACHGPAEKWLIPHTERNWRNGPDARRKGLGFVDLRHDLEVRGKTCAKCHVGGPDRDVNHDLIAAGHPRLNFELSAYHANLPPHWDVSDDQRAFPVKDQATGSALEARLWVIGQLTTADAALDLLENRAGKPATAPWPEFAEYGCYACHHDLQGPGWRQDDEFLVRGRKPGSYPWGTWNFSMLTVLDPPQVKSPLAEALQRLEATMGQPNPARVDVVTRVMVARELIGSELKLQKAPASMTADRIRQLLQRITQDGQSLSKRDWDAAAQVYLATVALHQGDMQARGLPADPRFLDKLETLRGQLKFPEGPIKFASPRTFDGDRIKSIAAQLLELEKLVGQ